MTTHVALITTTINVPTVLETYVANVPDDVELNVVVAGDVKTPIAARELVAKLGGTYLDVGGKDVERWRSHALIGTCTIRRRNLALLHALTSGPDVVITVDDDNVPLDPGHHIDLFVGRLRDPVDHLTRSSTGWYNPGRVLEPRVVHRGFPLDQRQVTPSISTSPYHPTMGGRQPRVGVVAGLWFGDPDVDAIERITNRPDVYGFRIGSGSREITLDAGTWAPFNTQNTAYRWEMAPLMQCLVGVGRYDDIWMSYVARRVMDDLGWHVHYGQPLVRQDRNEHDLTQDLKNELYGYEHTPAFTTRLRKIITLGNTTDRLRQAYEVVDTLLPPRTREANEAWLQDVQVAVTEGTRRRSERE